jgi:hypothetical protein
VARTRRAIGEAVLTDLPAPTPGPPLLSAWRFQAPDRDRCRLIHTRCGGEKTDSQPGTSQVTWPGVKAAQNGANLRPFRTLGPARPYSDITDDRPKHAAPMSHHPRRISAGVRGSGAG